MRPKQIQITTPCVCAGAGTPQVREPAFAVVPGAVNKQGKPRVEL